MMAAKKEGWRERESRKSQCTAMLLLLTVRKKKGMLIRVHISFLPLRRLKVGILSFSVIFLNNNGPVA